MISFDESSDIVSNEKNQYSSLVPNTANGYCVSAIAIIEKSIN